MATIPKNVTDLADKIYTTYEKENEGPQYLTRIGASGIGEECIRAIWLDWRGFYDERPSGRMLRLFKTGFIQEERILEDLKKAGLDVWGFDEDGKQWTYVFANGHGVAKLDGVVKGVPGVEKTPHTLEIKSSNKKGFDELVKYGVQKAKPLHYSQMQMGLLGSKLKDALYIAVCKDDERLYIERVKRDESEIVTIEKKLEKLTTVSLAPPRFTEKQDDWRCRFCDGKAVCWGVQASKQNCRTCAYSSPENDGAWSCSKLGKVLEAKEQVASCDLWVSIL